MESHDDSNVPRRAPKDGDCCQHWTGLRLLRSRHDTAVGAVRHAAALSADLPETANWQDDARRSISAGEYMPTDAGAGLQAPNRALGLRTYFDSTGVRIVDRDNDANELLRLRTVAVGRRNATSLPCGSVVVDGGRVELRRPNVVEWYTNSEGGLEQGWTLATAPDGDGAVTIDVDLGNARAQVEGDVATIVSSARQLRYGGLSATDAGGVALAAHMELAKADRIRIVVDDAHATYPITVDPTLTQPAFATLTGVQASAGMGYSVAGAGDVNNDGFDDVIVGAPLYDSGQTDEGAAFIFLGTASGIASAGAFAANTRLESNQSGAELGVSVAGAGDVNHDGYADVIVGALYYDSGQTNEGAAFVFLGGPSGIANGNPTTAATTLQSDQANATFGYSVASAGDVNDDGFSDVIVGAPDYSSGRRRRVELSSSWARRRASRTGIRRPRTRCCNRTRPAPDSVYR